MILLMVRLLRLNSLLLTHNCNLSCFGYSCFHCQVCLRSLVVVWLCGFGVAGVCLCGFGAAGVCLCRFGVGGVHWRCRVDRYWLKMLDSLQVRPYSPRQQLLTQKTQPYSNLLHVKL